MGRGTLLSPGLLRTAAKTMGLTAARLDYDKQTQTLLLSVAQRGHVHQITVPIGVTFTRDQICELLAGGEISEPAAQPAPPAVATSPP